MRKKAKRRSKKIITILLFYCLFWGFVWGFLTVSTRSYNRLSHTPVVMAHLDLRANTLTLAEHTSTWEAIEPTDAWYFWMATLPNAAGDWAIHTWMMLVHKTG